MEAPINGTPAYNYRRKRVVNNERRDRKTNWNSIISFVIFVLVIAGRPIGALLNRLFGGVSSQSATILPLLVGAVVLATVVVAVFRAVSRSSGRASDVRLPTTPGLEQRTYTPGSLNSERTSTAELPSGPKFDPVLSPGLALIGVVGVLVLLGAGLVVVVGALP
jgi:ABC-type sugar transport system permease subunit